MKFNEAELQAKAEAHILRCRPGDWPHALRVVEWVRKLGVEREDLPLLLTTAYIHDIGWRDVLRKDKITFDELLELEEQANKNSENFASEFLEEMEYSKKEIDIINRLIRAADAHTSQEEDEAIIVDADNLSKLTIEHLREKYETSEWLKVYNLWKEELPGRIKTNTGKEALPRLLDELEISIGKLS